MLTLLLIATYFQTVMNERKSTAIAAGSVEKIAESEGMWPGSKHLC
jgi:hypothetical protein